MNTHTYCYLCSQPIERATADNYKGHPAHTACITVVPAVPRMWDNTELCRPRRKNQLHTNSMESPTTSTPGLRGSAAVPGSAVNVGTILRFRSTRGFRVFLVTGIHLGGILEEDIVSMRSLDRDDGSAYGQRVRELMVPLVMIEELRPNTEPSRQPGAET